MQQCIELNRTNDRGLTRVLQGTGYSFWHVLYPKDTVQLIRLELFLPHLLFARTKSFGDLSDVGTPGYIPNPVVKHVSADGTRRVTSRESRSLPKDFFCLNQSDA